MNPRGRISCCDGRIQQKNDLKDIWKLHQMENYQRNRFWQLSIHPSDNYFCTKFLGRKVIFYQIQKAKIKVHLICEQVKILIIIKRKGDNIEEKNFIEIYTCKRIILWIAIDANKIALNQDGNETFILVFSLARVLWEFHGSSSNTYSRLIANTFDAHYSSNFSSRR